MSKYIYPESKWYGRVIIYIYIQNQRVNAQFGRGSCTVMCELYGKVWFQYFGTVLYTVDCTQYSTFRYRQSMIPYETVRYSTTVVLYYRYCLDGTVQ